MSFMYNHKDWENKKSNSNNLDKPSLSTKSQYKLDQCVALYKKKQEMFLSHYTVDNIDDLNSSSTHVVLHNTQKQQTEEHLVYKIGSVDLLGKIWSWDWLDRDDCIKSGSPLIEIRNYGFHFKIETLTKYKWRASSKDILENCAIAMAIKSGMGIVTKVSEEHSEYFLVENPT